MKQKLLSILALLLVAATGAWAEDIDIDGGSRTISSDVSSDYFYMYEGTLTIDKGATVTLSNYFYFDEGSNIYLHGTLQGGVSKGEWNNGCVIHIYLNDGAKYTLSGFTAPSDACQIYYGYDAATDGNGTVSVKNGAVEVTSSSTGYKSTTYTFTASPNSGYKFKNWTKGAGSEVLGTDASINVTCEQNGQYQVYANFEADAPAAIFAIDTDGTTQDFGSVEAGATAQKTFTITNSGNKSLYVTISNPEDFTAEMTHNDNANVYFTDALGWGDIHVYYWPDGPDWPGAAMTELYTNELGQKVYCYELPAGVEGVIFNGNGNHTGDIFEAIGKAYYTKDEKDGNYYTVGTWSYNNCVPAGMSRVLTVTMNTATLGSKSGNITLSFDAKNATSFTIPCTGETVAPATKYDLTLADGSNAHGTVAFTVGGAAVTKAKKDDVVTVSVTPDEGYSAKDVTVSDINVTKQEDGTWQFTMPKDNVTVTVTYAKNLQDAWIQAIADQTYTGSAIEPTIEVKDGETTLVLNTDYTVAYSNNVETGTATVTVTGTGNYSGTATATFIIRADKTDLNNAITEAEAYYNSISESNPNAAAALLTAINAAKGVQNNADATQTEIETAAQTLNEAVNAAKADVALKRVTLTIPAKSYMTRIDADKRQIENAVTGVKLYSVKNVTNTEVELTDELGVIAAKMPYFIYNDNDTEVEVSIVVSSEDADNVEYDSEHFKGTLVDQTFTDQDMEEYDHYVLSGGSSFVWVKDAGVLSAGKCWIQLEKSPANARAMSIVFEFETTGISTVKTAADKMDGEWYDLSGRRIAQPAKGIYVKNGKKVIVK